MAEVAMQFQGLSKKQLDYLFEAEKYLGLAGVSFDTGYSFGPKIRVWELDWSLKGAKIVLKRDDAIEDNPTERLTASQLAEQQKPGF